MKSMLSKTAIAVVVAACLSLNVMASVHVSPADTGKMSKMNHKMDKKSDKMSNKSKMAKDSSKM